MGVASSGQLRRQKLLWPLENKTKKATICTLVSLPPEIIVCRMHEKDAVSSDYAALTGNIWLFAMSPKVEFNSESLCSY